MGIFAPTWHSGMIAISGQGKFVDQARNIIMDLVSNFLNDWLAVNPRNGPPAATDRQDAPVPAGLPPGFRPIDQAPGRQR
jgi:hypothetical protein